MFFQTPQYDEPPGTTQRRTLWVKQNEFPNYYDRAAFFNL
jgi:hypothetical protein